MILTYFFLHNIIASIQAVSPKRCKVYPLEKQNIYLIQHACTQSVSSFGATLFHIILKLGLILIFQIVALYNLTYTLFRNLLFFLYQHHNISYKLSDNYMLLTWKQHKIKQLCVMSCISSPAAQAHIQLSTCESEL